MEHTCNFILAPSNRYVGWVVHNNGYFFGSASTLGGLIRNVKQTLWKTYGSGVIFTIHLASKPTEKENMPFEKMSSRFKTRCYFGHKTKDKLTKEQKTTWERAKKLPILSGDTHEKVKAIFTKTEPAEYVYKEDNGYIIVSEVREVARYKLYDKPSTDPLIKAYLKGE